MFWKVKDIIQIFNSTHYSTKIPNIGRNCSFEEVNKACLHTILFLLCVYRRLQGVNVSDYRRLRRLLSCHLKVHSQSSTPADLQLTNL